MIVLTDFIFDSLDIKEVKNLAEKSSIFNYTRKRIDKEKVILISFDDEKLGSSMERLDFAVSDDFENWEILDVEDRIKGYNEIPLGYVTDKMDYKYLLVIIRSMSNMIMDKVKSRITNYIYCVVDDKLSGIEDINPIQGLLAKNKIKLIGNSLEGILENLSQLSEADRESVSREIEKIYKENTKMDKKFSELELTTLDNIGKNVRFIRRELLGVTLEGFAKSTGVSRDVICRLEALSDIGDNEIVSKIVYPSISTVIKFCNGVGIKPSQLFETQVEFNDEILEGIKEHCKEFMNVKNK